MFYLFDSGPGITMMTEEEFMADEYKSCKGRLYVSFETINSDLIELLNGDD